ncbi:hypothetical protein E2C01_097577 [Portunus trituberculatus]|uniref:Uncharacterized protein n=1 Tax=Portunus trituberculatus TaxID=210409 RepID=A0A5B7JVJ6_PORTR|nr:hypothetical protein [Portunus trituberculatus]
MSTRYALYKYSYTYTVIPSGIPYICSRYIPATASKPPPPHRLGWPRDNQAVRDFHAAPVTLYTVILYAVPLPCDSGGSGSSSGGVPSSLHPSPSARAAESHAGWLDGGAR